MTSDRLSFREAFERTQRLSPFIRRLATARPSLVDDLERRGGAPVTRSEMRQALAAGAGALDSLGPSNGLGSRLRELRSRVMLTLAHRDLNGLAALDEVFDTMTALADESIAAAAAAAQREAAWIHGAPQGDELVVVALGKLGGCELNVSSDVDLVFLHEADGETPGPKRVSHHEFFSVAGRGLIALLSEVTGEGQAFRVDMRLRPFGISGPLVASAASLEDYFVAHARPWERYAWLKARVVAGPGEGVDQHIQPFVYRRYLDYGLLDSLRELHSRIFEAAIQRRRTDDIKVGAGGIREIEFAVQLFQMVRGGRDAELRTTSTRKALAVIGERGLMEPARVTALAQAYAFLRKLEHRLQYYDDQQTQALPRTPEHRALIAEAMEYRDWAALEAELERHRSEVQRAFNELFEEAPRPAAGTARAAAALHDPQAAPDPAELAERLEEAGIAESAAVARRLIEYTGSRRFGSLSAASRAKVEKLLPELLAAAAQAGGSEIAVARLIELFEAIDRRDAYYSLLLEHPEALVRAARLMARSRWAARLLARHPILLDELARPAGGYRATDWSAEREELGAECAALAGDVERLLDHLRHYKQRQVLRFTVADLEGELPVMALSDELSALADLLLDVTLVEAAGSLEAGADGVGVISYGKLGGKELGYGSDLDVIFLYEDALAPQADRLARVAQRVNTWMTALTPAGVLYDIDMRLRPDGAKGLMVTSLAGFRDYQEKRAWTWEHQALTRARASAGDRTLGERFERLRDEILARPRDRAKLFAEVVAMRNKMRAEHRAESQSDLKHVAGGIIDLEFCVQALVLAEGPAHPRLRENKGNHTLLKWAGELALIDPGVAVAAADAYLAMRRRAHAAALNDEEKVTLAAGELEAEREAVKRLWNGVFGS